MPHCIVEYSESIHTQIAPETILETAFNTVQASSLFDPSNVRARSQSYANVHLGATQSDFIHITIRLLAGRSNAEKTELNQQVGEAIVQLGIKNVVLSCECVDIHTPSYYRAET